MEGLNDRVLKVTKSCNIAAGVIEPSAFGSENYVQGALLSNPKLSWISCGPRLTTLNDDDGSKRTGWTFGWSLGDPSFKVTSVEELPLNSSASPILIVACESEVAGSSLCFYHSGSSRVLKAIHFSEKITSLALVSKSNNLEENISRLIKLWSGIVAVGTSTGKVYLLDVWWNGLQKCIDDHRLKLYDEQKQSKLTEVSIQDLSEEIDCRTSSVKQGSSTLALWLNEKTLQKNRTASCTGIHNILGHMPVEFLQVSALKYFPQLGTLAVGYNTSCFQLWDLTTLNVLYTSALLEAMLPVYSFNLLEPSDDPKYVCYLWSLHHSVDEDSIPFGGMYILNYHEKFENDFNMQTFYQGFSSCSIRYQLDLGEEIDNAVSGRIISCQSINRSNLKSLPLWLQSSSKESSADEVSTASLLAITWEVWTPNQMGVYNKLTLFDLNQWYREYMPQSADFDYSHFMAHFTLPNGSLLDVKIIPNSVRQFVSLQPVDEHFYPPGLSFECVCLEQSQVIWCSHTGLQLDCLQALQESGPSALLHPAQLYKMFSHAGVRPLLIDHNSPSGLQSKEQREYLLSVALEFEMVQFLRNCVRDWCDGSHAVTGCTLPALLHWAWGRVERYKKWLDRLCVPLYDYLGIALDANDLAILHHVICQLHRIQDLFKLVLEKFRNFIIVGNFEQQLMAISLVSAFYDSILWCVRNKILPETNAGCNNSHTLPFMADKIVNATISRRAELHQLGKSLKQKVPSEGLYFVDAVIAHETGERLTDQWEREGGQVTGGKYPPPTIQSLLRTYLVHGISSQVKHFIVSYFLLDMLHAIDSNGLSESTKQKLMDYPSDFGLTESQCKIVEAFWRLDHNEFEEGVSLLLDSSINKEDLQLYQHRTVICLLLASGKHKLALHYLNIRKPALADDQDIKIKMTLLLVNDLIHEAFEFQRHNSSLKDELLEQFFTGCMEKKKLDVVFKLPLNNTEEEAFMVFLNKTSLPQADDLRVFYLLSRSRYVEAIDMNKKLQVSSKSRLTTERLPLAFSPLGTRTTNLFGSRLDSGAPAKVVMTTRDLIINSVAKSLPAVTRDLADHCTKNKNFNWMQVNRPTPLSVAVHTEKDNEGLPFYKMADSTLVHEALRKTRETWRSLLATPAALKRKHCDTIEGMPFLRTPIQPKFNFSASNTPPNGLISAAQRRREETCNKNSKRARLDGSPTVDSDATKTSNITSLKPLDMEITSAETVALLHTPHVARVVKLQPRESNTPHSILKGSAANTPTTPARTDKSLSSSTNSRQIRFNLPHENMVPSSPSSVLDDNEHYSPSLSPRKSIHEALSVKGRKGTPANPRVSRQPFRNAAVHLQFDDEETATQTGQKPEQSETAAALLKRISTSPSVVSDEVYFSFQSSSSGKNSAGGKSGESRLSFHLPLGLEGNIDCTNWDSSDHDDNPEVDLTVVENSETDDSIASAKDIVEHLQLNKSSELQSINLAHSSRPDSKLASSLEIGDLDERTSSETVSANQVILPKSPEEIRTIIEFSTVTKKPIPPQTACKIVSFQDKEETFDEDKSLDESLKKTTCKWTKEQDKNLKDIYELEVCRQSSGGGEQKNVVKLTLSDKMSMFSSETVDEDVFSTNEAPIKFDTDATTSSENLVFSETSLIALKSPSTEQDNDHQEDAKKCNIRKKTNSLATDETSYCVVSTEEKVSFGKENETDISKSHSLSQKFDQSTSTQETASLSLVLDELLKKGRISLNPKETRPQETSVSSSSEKSDPVDLQTAGTVPIFEPAFPNSTSVQKVNQPSVRWEFGINRLEDELSVETRKPQLNQSCDYIGNNNDTCPEVIKDDSLCCKEKDDTSGAFDTQNDGILTESNVQDEYQYISIKETTQVPNLQLTGSYLVENQPSDKNIHSFIIESTKSLSQVVYEDSAGDFELKLSEEDSVVETIPQSKSTASIEDTGCDLNYEILKPVEFQPEGCVDEEDIDVEDIEDNKDDDIYNDMIEYNKTDINESAESSNRSEENKNEVISLDSSSEEESNQNLLKPLKFSTPYRQQHTTGQGDFSPLVHETLDYEEDRNQQRDQSGDELSFSDSENEKKESLSTESSYSSSNSETEAESSESSESEENNCHRRSWKPTREINNSNESLNKGDYTSDDKNKSVGKKEILPDDDDDETIESPPYELIGHCSPKQSNPSQNFETYTRAESNLEQEPMIGDQCLPVIRNELSEDLGSKELTTNNSQDKLHEIAEISDSNLKFNLEVESEESFNKKTNTVTDIVKLAEDKRKQFLETGSISDLKKRRSKRYSSTGDLNQVDSRKLRRRSNSMHDFTSLIIKETLSATPVFSQTKDLSNIVENCKSNCTQPSSVCVIQMDKDNEPKSNVKENQNSVIDKSHDNLNSVPSSLIAEMGSVSSVNQPLTSEFPFIGGKSFDFSKKWGRSTKSHVSSLQDISEEVCDFSSDNRSSIDTNRKSLRKSLSCDQLAEQNCFKPNLPRRSSSVSKWSEYAKAHENEIMTDDNNDFDEVNESQITPKKRGRPCKKIKDNNTEVSIQDCASTSKSNESQETGDCQINFLLNKDSQKASKKHQNCRTIEFQMMSYVTSRRRSSSVTSDCDKLKVINSSDEENSLSMDSNQPNPEHFKDEKRDFEVSQSSEIEQGPKDDSPAGQFLANPDSSDPDESFDITTTKDKKRNLRAQSLPCSSRIVHEPKAASKKKSSSLLRLQHDKVLSRYSLNRKSTRLKPSADLLEIIHSDEETNSSVKKNEVFLETVEQQQKAQSSLSTDTQLANQEVDVPQSSKVAKENNRKRRGSSAPPHNAAKNVYKSSSLGKKSSEPNIHNISKQKTINVNTMLSKYDLKVVSDDETNSLSKGSRLSLNLDSSSETLKGGKDTCKYPNNIKKLKFSKKIEKGLSSLKSKNKKPKSKIQNEFEESSSKNETDSEDCDYEQVVVSHVVGKKLNKKKLTYNVKQLIQPSTSLTTEESNIEHVEERNIAKVTASVKNKSTKHIQKNVRSSKTKTEKKADDLKILSPIKESDKLEKESSHQNVESMPASDDPESITTKRGRKPKKTKLNYGDQRNLKISNDKDCTKSPTSEIPLKVETKDEHLIEESSFSQQKGKPKKKTSLKAATHKDSITEDILVKELTNNDANEETKKSKTELLSKSLVKKRTLEETDGLHETLGIKSSKSLKKNKNNLPSLESKVKDQSKNIKIKNALTDTNLSLFDSPAKRTRRSMSVLSDTEVLTPMKNEKLSSKKRVRRGSVSSDVLQSTPMKQVYAESETSEASTVNTPSNSKLNATPTRRTRKLSFSNTPNTPDNVPAEYVSNRRLTRNQHSLLQKSFEYSITESPKLFTLEDVPEESGETEESEPHTPVRSSSRNANRVLPNYSLTKKNKSKTHKN